MQCRKHTEVKHCTGTSSVVMFASSETLGAHIRTFLMMQEEAMLTKSEVSQRLVRGRHTEISRKGEQRRSICQRK